MCMSLVAVVIEDNTLNPLDTFLINEVSIEGALTEQVLTKFNTATQLMSKDPANFDFTGSTTVPVAFGEDAVIKYTYQISTDQKPLESSGVAPVETIEKEFIIKRTGR